MNKKIFVVFAIAILLAIIIIVYLQFPPNVGSTTNPRAVVNFTQNTNGTVQYAGVDCIPGNMVEVVIEINGYQNGTIRDAAIVEAFCDTDLRTLAQVTAQPPLGHDRNSNIGNQTNGTAKCEAAAFLTNPASATWTASCTFE